MQKGFGLKFLNGFQQQSNALTTTNAGGADAVLKFLASAKIKKVIKHLIQRGFPFYLLQLMHQVSCDARATGSQRMTQSNGTTIHIQLGGI